MPHRHPPALSRRLFLKGSAVVGCSAAAWPLVTPVTFAAVPGDARLVVIILRGAMDGLDVVRPVGDPDFARLRPVEASRGADSLPLDGFFALHPALADLVPLWQTGELGFAHAVATPYRGKRSHFDGQDILEAGTVGEPGPGQDGWLNRVLQSMPGVSAQTAYAVGRDQMKLLEGDAPIRSWAPDTELSLSVQDKRLLERIYENDPLFHSSSQQAIELSELVAGSTDQASGRQDPSAQIAAFAADRLRDEARIVSFSVDGWDTHRDQARAISRRLKSLSGAIMTLKARLGPTWAKTTVLAMTEFGRTARANGTKGTDHGTGGVTLMAGGAIHGGKVYGDWPGLTDADLFNQRDLMPTTDVRSYAGWAMRGLYGFDTSLIENTVFPGLDMGADPGILL